MNRDYIFSSESVTEGHPDKVCDLIADALLDAYIEQDPKSRVACEVLCKDSHVIIAGEIRSSAHVDIEQTTRLTIRSIGYSDLKRSFNAERVRIVNLLGVQAADIAHNSDSALERQQRKLLPHAVVEGLKPRLTKRRKSEDCMRLEGPSRYLVYRKIPNKPESLVFAPRARALYVHQVWQAINQAKTWKQFSAMLPDGEWLCLLDRLERKPRGSDKFNAEGIPGFSDGDYPPWLQTELAQCLPAIVREEFCVKQDSVLNGSFWAIPSDIEIPLIDRLRNLGYFVEQRNDWFFY